MAVGDAYVFPGFLKPVLTQLFFPKPPTTFSHMLLQRWKAKIRWKESHLNLESNSQPPSLTRSTLSHTGGVLNMYEGTPHSVIFFLHEDALNAVLFLGMKYCWKFHKSLSKQTNMYVYFRLLIISDSGWVEIGNKEILAISLTVFSHCKYLFLTNFRFLFYT